MASRTSGRIALSNTTRPRHLAITAWVALAIFIPLVLRAGPEQVGNPTSVSTPPCNPVADGPVVEIVTAFSPTVVPLPADKDFIGNGLISQYAPTTTPLQYAVHLTLRGAHDDNIALTHIDRIADEVVQIQPSLMLGIGDVAKQDTFLAAIYITSLYRYEDHHEFDSDQHVAHVLGGIQSGNLTLKISQDVSILNNIVLAATSEERSALGAINGRTNIEIYDTKASARYNMTSADFLVLDLRMYRVEYTPPLIGYRLLTADGYVNHGFSNHVILGVGVLGGNDLVDVPTPDQTFVQANAHLNYAPSCRFSLDVILGAEFRDFEDDTRDTYTTPVFQVAATMLPWDQTRIILSASRQIYNSAAALVAQDYIETTVTGTIRERVCKQIYLTLVGGYSHLDYFNTFARSNTLTLSDDYYYVQPSIDLLLTRYLSVGGYYLHRENTASVSTADFVGNQYGARLSVKF